MSKYMKLIILSVVLLGLIALVTLSMIFDVNLLLFKNLSITTIQQRDIDAKELAQNLEQEELNNTNAKQSLDTAKASFEKEKKTYENIDKSTIEIVEEATIEQQYFVEYLWVVLGGYAMDNNVDIGIVTQGTTIQSSTNSNNTTSGTGTNNNTNNNQTGTGSSLDQFGSSIGATGNTGTTGGSTGNATTSTTYNDSGLKVAVEGRYANIADFIFDVENDKSLRFKLDNIKMTYVGNNEIKAQFDVLSLSVLK